jgi:aldose 1-epimerase
VAAATVGIAGAISAIGHNTSAAGAPAPAARPTISKAYFGSTDGQDVYRYTLTSGRGETVRILTYGGIIQSIQAPDRSGKEADITLGFPTLQDYVTYNSPAAGGGVYFGSLVGRYANRIAKGTFTLDGTTYHVPINNNGNSLHGGIVGFNQHIWTPVAVSSTATSVSLSLKLVSPNGDQGYPGTLTTTATYTLNDSNALSLHFNATTDAPTVVNLTNHTYWNLGGEDSGTVENQTLRLNADHYTPTDSTQIPTGQIAPVKGTPFDFTKAKPIGQDIRDDNQQLLFAQGFDHNWVLNRPAGDNGLVEAAQATDPANGRVLTIYTTQPGIQFYSGNFLNATLVGTSGHIYRQTDGFALETQHFPNSPNQPNFPTTTLNPGQVYSQTTVWQLSTT